MKTTKLFISIFTFSLILIVAQVSAQTETKKEAKIKKVNFGYSTNPIVKSTKKNNKKDVSEKESVEKASEKNNQSGEKNGKSEKDVAVNDSDSDVADNSTKDVDESKNLDSQSDPSKKEKYETIAQKTLAIAKRANKSSMPLTEIYRIGVGDVLFINLQNVSSQNAKYFTVLDDGTVDYPLAGEMISVVNLTTVEIEDYLREKIKLYENPQISVNVREYGSHKINVLGMVEKPGDKFLQREAIPLYVIRAEAIVEPGANAVKIKRKNSTLEEFDLSETTTDEVLVYAGDIVEFTGIENSTSSANGFYYIGGEIEDGGQMNFHKGITLSQAILASGGVKDTKVKKVVIRRKDDKGLLKSTTYNLNDIKKGKTPDPLLQIGDIIEVGS